MLQKTPSAERTATMDVLSRFGGAHLSSAGLSRSAMGPLSPSVVRSHAPGPITATRSSNRIDLAAWADAAGLDSVGRYPCPLSLDPSPRGGEGNRVPRLRFLVLR